jgi:hypothetical protein
MTINDEQLDTMLASVASQDWNGPSFNQRVEREILERAHAMQMKKRTTWMAGIVVGASLMSAGVAAAVTHRIVTATFTFEAEGGGTHTFTGDYVPNEDGSGGIIMGEDGTPIGEWQSGTSEHISQSSKPE